MWSGVLSLLAASVVLFQLTSCNLVVKNIWGSGFDGELNVPVPSNMNGWTGEIIFPHPTDHLNIWTAEVVSSNADKSVWKIKNVNWNGQLVAGSMLSLQFVVYFPYRSYDEVANRPFAADEPRFVFEGGHVATTNPPVVSSSTTPAVVITETNSPVTDPVNPTTTPAVVITETNSPVTDPVNPTTTPAVVITPGSKYSLAEAIRLSNLFYEAQRSGRQAPDKMVDWRFDSSVDDKGNNGEDLSGGWHDAGDHVKFGFPMASSATMLLSGLVFFKEGYEAAGQYDNTLRTVRWPLEYFIKCHVSDTLFYGQVGNGAIDHAWWGRPEDMTISRPAYSVGNGNGGADLLGETAAAMAVGSHVFKDKDAVFSASLLSHAKRLYNMALRNPGDYGKSIIDARTFYSSSEWRDELALAAAWLAYATGEMDSENKPFTAEARKYLSQLPGTPWAVDWSDKRGLARVLMYHMTKDNQYKVDTEALMTEWLPGGSVLRTPKGLAWRLQWGSLRYASNAAFVALIAAKDGIMVDQLVDFAKSQIHYILGDNGRSYLVGFGNNYPKRPHHKAASCNWKDVDPVCDWNDYNSDAPNPHVLNGALVGGPGRDDRYEDVRSNYVSNEVACDYNAGFQGALAGLKLHEVEGSSVFGR